MARLKVGSVHGRFQPFHNGHLDYVLQAFDRADFIWVGLTQIFRPPSDNTGVASRENASANPFSFRERSDLVERALLAAGIASDRFQVTPFPIEDVQHLSEFIPAGCVCFTTRVDDWNDVKIKRLNENGFPTEILALSTPDNMRVTSGTEIRRLLRMKEPSWARFVPTAVAEMISTRFTSHFDVI